MNPTFFGIIIFILVFLFLYWFVNTSSKKIAKGVRSIIIVLSIIIAVIFLLFGRFLLSLPFLILIFPLLKIKGGLSLFQALQIFRLLNILRQQGRYSFRSGTSYSQQSSSVSLNEAYDILNCSRGGPRKKIEANYRKLMLKLHPDKNKDIDSTKISQILTEAKDLIIKTDFS